MKAKTHIFFYMLVLVVGLAGLDCEAQALSNKEITVMNRLSLPPSQYDLNNSQIVLNIQEIVRLESSRRGAMGVGIGITATALLPTIIGMMLNIDNGEWVDDPMGNGMMISGAGIAAFSIPFYAGAWSLKKRRNRSIEKLRFLTP